MSLFHPIRETVDIVGTNTNTLGHTCELHRTFGIMIWMDTVLCLRSIEMRPGETAIVVFWVTDSDHHSPLFIPQVTNLHFDWFIKTSINWLY